MQAWTKAPRSKTYRGKAVGLTLALLLVAALAAGFSVAVVQIQSAIAAYIGGQSAWSRAQLAAVYNLDTYAETGHPDALQRSRDWLAVPLGGLDARRALDATPVDLPAARDGLLRGLNHPDDIGRMIWLYRLFAEYPLFHEAVHIWRESDTYLLELVSLTDQLADEWQSGAPSMAEISRLRTRLQEVNRGLTPLTEDFRRAMTDASREMRRVLSLLSVAFLLVMCLIAGLLGWHLSRVITAAEHKFRVTFEQAAVGMAQVDDKGYLIDVNQALCGILHYPKEALLGMRYRDLVYPEDWDIGRQQRADMLAGTINSYTLEQRFLCRAGDTVWVKLTASRMLDDTRRAPLYVVIIEDVSESRRLSVELDYQATHDVLTGLPNRRSFERSLAEALRQARTEDSTHALCLVDLDQFKIVNDTSGHVAGDQLLRQTADLLHSHLREGDLLARLGGDEFAVILENCDVEKACQVTEKLRAIVSDTPFSWEGTLYMPGCSIGVVPITASSSDTGSLLRTADIACYLAKEQGRNRVHLLQENDRQLAEQRGEMEWLGRIRSALAEQRIFLDAQRLVCLARPDSLRYEVLVRLIDENGAVIPPGDFLPAAERFGAAHQIDRWVIEHVCQQLAAHPQHLARLEVCHINLSGRSFDHADFHDFVVETLDHYALPPSKLCFEITETAAVRNLHDVTTFMEKLSKRGCTFALDDFGAGLSSFGYLRCLPVDCLKIDGLFVRDIANDETDLAMVRAINQIGQTLNKIIVAEFVETDEALELLREMGVHYAQGYGVHRPCRFKALLAETS